MLSIREIYKEGYGPSSSHTIGPARAAEIMKQRHPQANYFRVALYGSLALTGKGHHTDSALQKSFLPKQVEIIWRPEETPPIHPNGMLIEAFTEGNGPLIDSWEVYSIGGGDLKDRNGVHNGKQVYPLNTMTDILAWCRSEGKSLWEFVEDNEGKEIWDFLSGI